MSGPTMKLWSVPVEAICTVLVFSETEDEALSIACDALDYGDLEMVNGGPAELIEEEPSPYGGDEGIRDSHIRHADVIVDEDGRRLRKAAALARVQGGAK